MHTQSMPSVRPSSPLVPSFGEQDEEFDAPIDGSSGRKEAEDCTTPFEPIVVEGPNAEDSWALVPYRPLQLGCDISALAESEAEASTYKVGDKSRFGRVYHHSHHIISPYTNPCKKNVILNLKRPINASQERAFDEWYRLAPNGATVCTDYMMVEKKFFDELLTPAGWLSSDVSYILYFHVNSLCSYVWNDALSPHTCFYLL